MFAALSTTLIAGAVDGLNPIAFTQQFVLQSKAKTSYSILYYILGNSLVNFLFGIIFYFGFSQWILQGFNWLNSEYPNIWYALSLIVAVIILGYLAYKYLPINQKAKSTEGAHPSSDEIKNPEDTNLSNGSLFMIGAATCVAELTSAAPYLAYLAYLSTANLNTSLVIGLLVLYSFVLYVFPLYILFFMALFFNSRLTTIYTRVSKWLDFALTYILPVALGVIAIALLIYGIQVF